MYVHRCNRGPCSYNLPPQEINMCAPGEWMFVIWLLLPCALILSDLGVLDVIGQGVGSALTTNSGAQVHRGGSAESTARVGSPTHTQGGGSWAPREPPGGRVRFSLWRRRGPHTGLGGMGKRVLEQPEARVPLLEMSQRTFWRTTLLSEQRVLTHCLTRRIVSALSSGGDQSSSSLTIMVQTASGPTSPTWLPSWVVVGRRPRETAAAAPSLRPAPSNPTRVCASHRHGLVCDQGHLTPSTAQTRRPGYAAAEMFPPHCRTLQKCTQRLP